MELTEITAEKIAYVGHGGGGGGWVLLKIKFIKNYNRLAARVRQTQDTVAAMTVEARAIQAELIDLRLQRGAVKPAADPLPSVCADFFFCTHDLPLTNKKKK